MPKNYPRVEVHFPPELKLELEKLKAETKEKTGKSPSMNALVVEVVRQFFENPNRSCISVKKE